jgi:hypothetical protein
VVSSIIYEHLKFNLGTLLEILRICISETLKYIISSMEKDVKQNYTIKRCESRRIDCVRIDFGSWRQADLRILNLLGVTFSFGRLVYSATDAISSNLFRCASIQWYDMKIWYLNNHITAPCRLRWSKRWSEPIIIHCIDNIAFFRYWA